MVNADQPAAGRYNSKTSRLNARLNDAVGQEVKICDILMYNQYKTAAQRRYISDIPYIC